MSGVEWTNLNTFAARPHNVINGLPYLDVKGLFALLGALEESIPMTGLDNPVPPAACWILYAGFKLKTMILGIQNLVMMTARNERLGTLGIYTMDQKDLTRRDGSSGGRVFGFLKDQGELKEETELYAERAWREMVRLDEEQASTEL